MGKRIELPFTFRPGAKHGQASGNVSSKPPKRIQAPKVSLAKPPAPAAERVEVAKAPDEAPATVLKISGAQVELRELTAEEELARRRAVKAKQMRRYRLKLKDRKKPKS